MPLAFTTASSSYPNVKKTLSGKHHSVLVLLLAYFAVLIPQTAMSSTEINKKTPLQRINPWLSACDLVQPAPPDLLGTCSATQLPPGAVAKHPLITTFSGRSLEPTIPLPDPVVDSELAHCPKACSDSSKQQCLQYFVKQKRVSICEMVTDMEDKAQRRGWTESTLKSIRFQHCCEARLYDVLSYEMFDEVLSGGERCEQALNTLQELDALAARITCEFTEVLSRFDCNQPYSVRYTCEDCTEAYRQWVCSSLMPYFVEIDKKLANENNGESRKEKERRRVRPCRTHCQLVERKCPYFLPGDRAPAYPTQYAGEPTFLCMDPNIPETGEQLKKSLYSEDEQCCFSSCGYLKGFCVKNECGSDNVTNFEEAKANAVDCSTNDTTVSRSQQKCTLLPSSPHNLHSSSSINIPLLGFVLFIQVFLLKDLIHQILYKMQYLFVVCKRPKPSNTPFKFQQVSDLRLKTSSNIKIHFKRNAQNTRTKVSILRRLTTTMLNLPKRHSCSKLSIRLSRT